MLESFDPRIDILPMAQREIWSQLAPASDLAFVLYGGTAVALQLGHRVSVDFDFFRTAPLDKALVEASFGFARNAQTIQDDKNTLVSWKTAPAGTEPPGWEWVWELDAQGPDSTDVTLTYDWEKVTDKDLLSKVHFPLVSKDQLETSLGNLAAASSGS